MGRIHISNNLGKIGEKLRKPIPKNNANNRGGERKKMIKKGAKK